MDSKVSGYILRELRRQRGLTLRGLSEHVDIDYSYLSKIETGAAIVQPHHLVILARFYQVQEEDFYRESDTFFDDLKEVLDANLQHRQDRAQIRTSFVEKYEYLRISQYLPYIQFVELENMAYSGIRDKYFLYLIETLDEDLLKSPYRYFLLFRKLYWACQQNDKRMVNYYTPIIENQMLEIPEQYRPFGYYYLLAGYAVIEDSIKIARIYDLAHNGFVALNNHHFAMLSDIVYGGFLVTHRDYSFSIQFYRKLLHNENYKLTNFSKRSILFNIGEAYLQLGDYRGALQYYKQSWAFAPQKSCAFFAAFCMFQVGKDQDAIELIDSSTSISEDNALFSELLDWFRRFINKRHHLNDDVIKRLIKIEDKYEAKIDFCLKLTLLTIKVDFYKNMKDLTKENHYLREMINELKKR